MKILAARWLCILSNKNSRMASEIKKCTSDICQTIPSMIKSVLIAFAKPYQKQEKQERDDQSCDREKFLNYTY